VAPKKRDLCPCFGGEDLEIFPVFTEMVGSRAAAPFDEERISLISAKVSVSLTSEGSFRFLPGELAARLLFQL